MDFKKAYDSIHRASLICYLREFNSPQKLIINEMSITKTFIKIKIGEAETEPIFVKSGLRQGDSMPPILFILILEKANS